jgi:hypothetical protein
MTSVILGRVLANAVVDAYGIDGKKHPVTSVEFVAGFDELAQIRVSFVLQKGDLENIDRMIAKVGAGGTAA